MSRNRITQKLSGNRRKQKVSRNRRNPKVSRNRRKPKVSRNRRKPKVSGNRRKSKVSGNRKKCLEIGRIQHFSLSVECRRREARPANFSLKNCTLYYKKMKDRFETHCQNAISDGYSTLVLKVGSGWVTRLPNAPNFSGFIGSRRCYCINLYIVFSANSG